MNYLYKCNIFLDISMTSPLLPLHVAGRSELFYEYILRKKMFVFQDKSEKILWINNLHQNHKQIMLLKK